MDFQALADGVGRDKDYPERQHRLNMLGRVLDGTIYDHLQYPFSTERVEGTGEYIPIHKRRPSARHRLCGTVVDDSVSLLFSDGRFPTIDCEDEATRKGLAEIIKDARIPAIMVDAATKGSVGSICLWLRILAGRVFVAALDTQYLTPTFDPLSPDTLIRVTERYKVRGAVLKDMGYVIADADTQVNFWFKREWSVEAETWFTPVKVGDDLADNPPIDAARTVRHSLGFCPMVWIRNLPGGDAIDGASTMVREALDTQVEIDYQLSQAGRGLRYASDPTLLIKEPSTERAPIARTASQALIVSADGDAKLLEINGTAAEAVMNYVRGLRELAIESMHGNRANADKLSAAQSGRAMELMNQSLIWLADKLRTSYGEGGLLPLLRMILAASAAMDLNVRGKLVTGLNTEIDIALRWPKWFSPTYADSLTQAQSYETLTDAGLMSRETAVHNLAPDYDIEDPAAEVALIEREEAEELAEQKDMLAAKAASKPPTAPRPALKESDD